MRVLWKLTTRSRPDKMFRSIDNIRAVSVSPDPWIIISMDANDGASNDPEVRRRLGKYPNVYSVFGVSKNKIDAFNRDVPAGGWDIIVPTSDDIQFFYGAEQTILNDALLLDDMDGTIWYNDGADHGKIMTVPIMTRKYYQRLGYIYNPIYTSLFCDEEAIHVGEKLGKILYSDANILEHMHPAWGKAQWDTQYRETDSYYHQDRQVFELRKLANFPL